MRARLLLALSERLATTRTIAEVSVAVEQVAHASSAASRPACGCARWPTRCRRPAPRPPPQAGPAEPSPSCTTRSPTGPQATTHTTLAVGEDNPLGAALLPRRAGGVRDPGRPEPRLPAPGDRRPGRRGTRVHAAGRGRARYGALALVWPEARDFDDEDRVTIGSLMSYTAQAVQRALLLQERVDVAVTLQNAMLTRLPQPDHLELVARYRPAAAREQVGGDWYDAVVMPDGATTYGRRRGRARHRRRGGDGTAARDAARVRLDPPTTRRPATSSGSTGPRSTWSWGRWPPWSSPASSRPTAEAARGCARLRWTTAGHPPPMLLHPDGTVDLLGEDAAIDPMLGAAPERDRHDQTADPAGRVDPAALHRRARRAPRGEPGPRAGAGPRRGRAARQPAGAGAAGQHPRRARGGRARRRRRAARRAVPPRSGLRPRDR